MSIECTIRPNPHASIDELKELGRAVSKWCSAESGAGGMCDYISHHALEALLAGELPPTLGLILQIENRAAGGEPYTRAERRQMERDAGPSRDLHLGTVGDPRADHSLVSASLGRFLPARLISDVRIDGQSWNTNIEEF
jgi:hypothetical protein